jgi:hypothetical protein
MSENVTSWFPHMCERMVYEEMSSKGFSVRRISPFERIFKSVSSDIEALERKPVGGLRAAATATAAAKSRCA